MRICFLTKVSLMYFLILLVRLMDPFLTEIGNAKVGEDVLKLLHSQWLEFLRISLWGVSRSLEDKLSYTRLGIVCLVLRK